MPDDHAPMSTDEALNFIGQQLNHFRAMKRGEEILQLLQGAEQRSAEFDAAAMKAQQALRELQHNQRQAEEKLEATKAEAQALHEKATAAASGIVEAAQADAARIIAEANVEVVDVRKKLNAARGTLKGIEAETEEATAKLADVTARLAAAREETARLLSA